MRFTKDLLLGLHYSLSTFNNFCGERGEWGSLVAKLGYNAKISYFILFIIFSIFFWGTDVNVVKRKEERRGRWKSSIFCAYIQNEWSHSFIGAWSLPLIHGSHVVLWGYPKTSKFVNFRNLTLEVQPQEKGHWTILWFMM